MKALGLLLLYGALWALEMIGTTVIVYGIGRYLFGFWS